MQKRSTIMKQIIGLLIFIITVSPILTVSSYAQQTEALYLSETGSDNTVVWDFFCAAGRKSGEWTKIPVPSNWEFEGFGQFMYGHDKERINESGMYRYQFSVPENWKRAIYSDAYHHTDATVCFPPDRNWWRSYERDRYYPRSNESSRRTVATLRKVF
jgi:hypothetical protein